MGGRRRREGGGGGGGGWGGAILCNRLCEELDLEATTTNNFASGKDGDLAYLYLHFISYFNFTCAKLLNCSSFSFAGHPIVFFAPHDDGH